MKEARTKPRKKLGRPTTLTPKRQEMLLRLVAAGKTFREACRAAKVNVNAVIEKRATDDEFHKASARAIMLGVEANMEMVEERLKHSTNRRISVDRELAHHYRWKASKLLSAYKDRLTVAPEGSMPDDSPLNMIESARRIAFVLRQGAEAVERDRQRTTLRLSAPVEREINPAPLDGEECSATE